MPETGHHPGQLAFRLNVTVKVNLTCKVSVTKFTFERPRVVMSLKGVLPVEVGSHEQ